MITLYSFGPAFGLPDPSPFVMKAEVLLKMSGLPYRTDTRGFRNAPKGKQPYIDDDGERVADSTFIRWYLEKKYTIDFDRDLTPDTTSSQYKQHVYDAITAMGKIKMGIRAERR